LFDFFSAGVWFRTGTGVYPFLRMHVLLHVLASLAGLGPGAGPWFSEPAAAHALNETLLAAAADAIRALVPERYCLLIVKDGVIVHESTYANRSDTQYESDSLAKTATALVIGAAVHAGLFDLDTPLAAYGMAPTCSGDEECWRANCTGCPTGPLGFWPNMTARALLAQASGCVTGEGCSHPPGTAFTYDSEDYIQHLAHLLDERVRATSGGTALQWASQLMATLGLPAFYADDDVGDEFSAGGGQRLSCRDAARFAQLVLNRGLWPSPVAVTKTDTLGGAPGESGDVQRLVDEQYISQMLSPQFASRGFSYGFLIWLNAERASFPESSPCCAPRWGPEGVCSGSRLQVSLLGDDLSNRSIAPTDIGLAMGWLGQYMFVVPSRNLSIVSLGASWGSSLQCRLGSTSPDDPPYNDGYDDAFSASVLWKALDEATLPGSSSSAAAAAAAAAAFASASTATTAAAAATAATAASAAASASAIVATATLASPPPSPLPPYGSCSCACPPGRGFGGCYALTSPPNGSTDLEKCAPFLPIAQRDCPAVGIVRQCASPVQPGDEDCASAAKSMRGDVGNPTVWGGHLNCSLRAPCRYVALIALDGP
jgi:CubicO group peptidase (beta-lactamase class C family)